MSNNSVSSPESSIKNMTNKMMPLSEWLIADKWETGETKVRDTAIRWLRAGHLKGKIFFRCTNCDKEYAVVDYLKDRCPKCNSKEKTRRGAWFISTPPGKRESTPPPAGRRWPEKK